jgi:pyrroloquinoline quinone biosynthesis protein B
VKVRVLGSAAGGGFPQWNCGCRNCTGLREGRIRASARTQASVAVSGDGRHWYLIGASPEIRAQIESYPELWPRAPRHTPLVGVLLCNADLDHCLGLLSLREWSQLRLYATDAVRQAFTASNSLYRALERYPGHTTWETLTVGATIALPGGLHLQAVPVPGKPPLYASTAGDDPIWNVALRLSDAVSGRSLFYCPSAARITPTLRAALNGVDCLFFDGTVWSENELIEQGLARVSASQMAHLPVGGNDGSLAQLQDIKVPRRFFIHINNSNPMLREDSPEAETVNAAGWALAWDGLEIDL